MSKKYIKGNIVRGQYDSGVVTGKTAKAYREEGNVAPESISPTFFAGKFYIDNWRWAGVPFYVRTGKRLAKRVSEIVIEFKQPPLMLFGKASKSMPPNKLILSIQPLEEISLSLSVKTPGVSNLPQAVRMDFDYEDIFRIKSLPAYERILIDCVKGDLTLFARQDGIEAMWNIVDPIIHCWNITPAPCFPNYVSGSFGPERAEQLMIRDGRLWNDCF